MTASANHSKSASNRKPALPDLGPVEHLPPELLRPYARNARTHSERQVALIAQSIETFGFTNPIIADEDGMIIAGHGRWEAVLLLALTTVPVLRSRHMTAEKVNAYRIADNKLADSRTHSSLPVASTRCLIPGFDGALFTVSWKEALWAKCSTGAPQRLRQWVERYSIVKRA